MKFVDVKNDIAFRKIFGNEKKTEIIISFLNAILKLEGDNRIKGVSIVNPFQLPRIAGEKASIIDVRAIDLKSRQFVIEMQIAETNGFDKRVQYYSCRDYSMQIDKGEDYPKLKPTYFIGILDFNYFDSKNYLSHHLLLDSETYEHKLKDIKFTFIELNKFTKEIDELETLVEKWVFFIKKSDELEVIPGNIDDKGLLAAYYDADKHSWTKEELRAYDNASMAEGAIVQREKFVIDRAIEGNKYKVVEKCLVKNMAVADIADIVEKNVEEVLIMIEEIKKRKQTKG